MTNQAGPAFIDNPQAPDVFADAATGFFIFGGNLRITFESLRVNHATQIDRMTDKLGDLLADILEFKHRFVSPES